MTSKFASAGEMRAASEKLRGNFNVQEHDIARKVKLQMEEASNLGHTTVVVNLGAYHSDIIQALIKHLETPAADGTVYKVEPQNKALTTLMISW